MHLYHNSFYSINLSVEQVYKAKKNWIAILYRKIGWEKVKFREIIYCKNSNRFFFIFDKVRLNWGSDFTLQVPTRYGIYGTWSKKNLKVCKNPKFRFLPIVPEFTSTRLRINQNLVEDYFLYILYNFEVKRTLFGESGKIFPEK